MIACGAASVVAGPVSLDSGMPIAGDPHLRLWLDASDLSTLWQNTAGTLSAANGFDVALWQDKSGNAKHVANSDAAHLPTYSASIGNLNNSPALQFVGGSSGDVLFRVNDLGITGNADRTVVTVWQSTSFTDQYYQHTFHMGTQNGNAAYGHSVSHASGAGSRMGNHYWWAGFDSTATAALNTPRLAVSSWDGDAGTGGNGLDSWWVNGAASGAGERAALNTGTAEVKIGSRLNGGTAGNEGFTGDLAEVIVFDTALTVLERNSLGYYLENKYGIPVQNAALYPEAALYPSAVFVDNFNAPNATLLKGKAPVLGAADWEQTSGLDVTIKDGKIDTTGGARVLIGTFTDALGSGEMLTLSFDATKLSTGGFAGISLLAGNSEELFVGDADDGTTWTMAASHAGGVEGTDKFSSLLTSAAGKALFTYCYNTGFATLSINGGSPITGLLPAGAAIDRLQIWNNHGGDIALDSINVTIVPEPSTALLVALPLLGLAIHSRRKTRA